MNYLERVSEKHKGFFVDLFVRASNNVAIDMYKKLGYNIYRTVNKYYSSSHDSSGEDAHGTLSLIRHEKVPVKGRRKGNIKTDREKDRAQGLIMELICFILPNLLI